MLMGLLLLIQREYFSQKVQLLIEETMHLFMLTCQVLMIAKLLKLDGKEHLPVQLLVLKEH